MTEATFSTPLIALEAVALDTETTGLDAKSARVIQIAAVRISNGALATAAPFDTLVDPGVPVPAATTKVHGITDAALRGQPAFKDVAGPLGDYIGARVVIGHTVGYDMTVLGREHAAAGLAAPRWRTLDVRPLARIVAPGLAGYSLDRLCEWLGIAITQRHSALGDAEAAAQVFLALLPRLREKNVRTLAEAEAASRAQIETEMLSGARQYAIDGPPPPPALQRIDSFAYRTRVADVMSAPPLFADPEMPLRDVMRQLVDPGSSSVFVRLVSGDVGIITERDVLRAINAGGPDALAAPANTYAQAPLQSVRADDYLYRALGRMSRLGIRHLGVTDAGGTVVGAVTTRNLLKHRASAATVLGDAIEQAASAVDLAAAWSRLAPMARGLMADDVPARAIAGVVSAEICAMTTRATELAVRQMRDEGRGSPPQPFAVLVLGSAGRGESQLAADQDNAIVYGQGAENSPADQWFAAMATRMTDILDQAGIPLCKGGVMARNRTWRMDVADWTTTIKGWVRRQRPEDLLSVDIFFDAVPVYGASELAERLWAHAYTQAHGARGFQHLLTENARSVASPFTLFGGLRTDEKGRIDVKRYGLMPLFTAARVLSIRHDVRARSSAERMQGFAARTGHNADEIAGIVAAQETLLGFVIGQQLIDIESGVPPSTRVLVSRLSAKEKAALKAALAQVAVTVDLVAEGRL